MMTSGSKKIRIRLIEAGLTGALIARTAGVHRTAIYHVIEGRSRSPRLRKAIASALGCGISDLWQDGRTAV